VKSGGFSLVELAIVIIIIGILMGAAMSGNNLIKNASNYSQMQQLNSLKMTYGLFDEAYRAVPGDFAEAHVYWSNSENTICGTEAECNGDGDRMIEINEKKDSEQYRAWQHLYLSGLFMQEHSGVWGTSDSVPRGKIKDTNISIVYDNKIDRVNVLKVGKYVNYKGQDSDGAVFFPETLKKIDRKLDDGHASKGLFQAMNGFKGGDKKDVNNWETSCMKDGNYNVRERERGVCVALYSLDELWN
jgi:prepilin-type N-terminal cleavage/methylation domain-containing protein